MNQRIGTCSLCGGAVTTYFGAYGGVTPPNPSCEGCGAIYGNHHNQYAGCYPILPMQPKTLPIKIGYIELGGGGGGGSLGSVPGREGQWLTDEDKKILEAVRNELGSDCDDGNAPGCGHSIPGIWDSDNGARAGKPCAWCLTWKKFTDIIDREAKRKDETT